MARNRNYSEGEDAIYFVVILLIILFCFSKCSCTRYQGENEDVTVKLFSETGEVIAEHKVDSFAAHDGFIAYKIGAAETTYKGQYLVIRKPKPEKPKTREEAIELTKKDAPTIIESPKPVEKEKP